MGVHWRPHQGKDVFRVRRELACLGVTQRGRYKTAEATKAGLYDFDDPHAAKYRA